MLSAYVMLANICRPYKVVQQHRKLVYSHCTCIMPNMFCFARALLYAALMGQNDTRALSKKAVGATSHVHSGQDNSARHQFHELINKVFQSICVMCLLTL